MRSTLSCILLAALVLSGTLATAETKVSGNLFSIGSSPATFTNAQGLYAHIEVRHAGYPDANGSIDIGPGQTAPIPRVATGIPGTVVYVALTSLSNNWKDVEVKNAAFAIAQAENGWEGTSKWDPPQVDLVRQRARDPGDWFVVVLRPKHFLPGRNNISVRLGDRGSNRALISLFGLDIGKKSNYNTNTIVIPIIAVEDTLGPDRYHAPSGLGVSQVTAYIRKIEESGWVYGNPLWIEEALSKGTRARITVSEEDLGSGAVKQVRGPSPPPARPTPTPAPARAIKARPAPTPPITTPISVEVVRPQPVKTVREANGNTVFRFEKMTLVQEGRVIRLQTSNPHNRARFEILRNNDGAPITRTTIEWGKGVEEEVRVTAIDPTGQPFGQVTLQIRDNGR